MLKFSCPALKYKLYLIRLLLVGPDLALGPASQGVQGAARVAASQRAPAQREGPGLREALSIPPSSVPLAVAPSGGGGTQEKAWPAGPNARSGSQPAEIKLTLNIRG